MYFTAEVHAHRGHRGSQGRRGSWGPEAHRRICPPHSCSLLSAGELLPSRHGRVGASKNQQVNKHKEPFRARAAGGTPSPVGQADSFESSVAGNGIEWETRLHWSIHVQMNRCMQPGGGHVTEQGGRSCARAHRPGSRGEHGSSAMRQDPEIW